MSEHHNHVNPVNLVVHKESRKDMDVYGIVWDLLGNNCIPTELTTETRSYQKNAIFHSFHFANRGMRKNYTV